MEEPGPSRFRLEDFSMTDALIVCTATTCPRSQTGGCNFIVDPHSIEKAQGKHLMVCLGERCQNSHHVIENDLVEFDLGIVKMEKEASLFMSTVGEINRDDMIGNGQIMRKILGRAVHVTLDSNHNDILQTVIKEEPVTDYYEDSPTTVNDDLMESPCKKPDITASCNNKNEQVSALKESPELAQDDTLQESGIPDSSPGDKVANTETAHQNAKPISFVAAKNRSVPEIDQEINTRAIEKNDNVPVTELNKDPTSLFTGLVKKPILHTSKETDKYVKKHAKDGYIDENANEPNFTCPAAINEASNHKKSALEQNVINDEQAVSPCAFVEKSTLKNTQPDSALQTDPGQSKAISITKTRARKRSLPDDFTKSKSSLCSSGNKRRCKESMAEQNSGDPMSKSEQTGNDADSDACISGIKHPESFRTSLVVNNEVSEGLNSEKFRLDLHRQNVEQGRDSVLCHAAESVQSFQCNKCGENCVDSDQLVAHLACHASMTHVFPKLEAQHQHEKTQHRDVKGHVCGICGQLCPVESDLRSHELTHLDDPRPFECDECGVKFTKKIYLKTHRGIHQAEKPHHCNICLKTFRRSASLKVHVKGHSGTEDYQCPYCDMILPSIGGFRRHQRLHTGERPFGCSSCQDKFIDKHDLGNHMRENHDAKKDKFNCNECGSGFVEKRLLRAHLQSNCGKGHFKCTECSQSFKTKAGLEIHKNMHNTEKSHRCKTCDKEFKHPSSLRYHMSTHMSPGRAFSCTVCEKKFRLEAVLKQHMKIHSEEKPHQCDKCGMRFTVVHYLRRHIMTHTNERKFACSICNKNLKSRGCLYAHMKIHTNNKPHQCQVCQKRFMYPKKLKDHMLLHEGIGLPFTCGLCGRRFRSLCGVIRHKKSHDSAQASHECTVCGKVFDNKGNLSQHAKVHVPVAELVCDVCGKAFKSLTVLKRHKNIHNPVKCFPCGVCEKKFNTKRAQRCHEKLHKEAKQFGCEKCGRMFMNRSALRLHEAKHQRENLPCPVCGKKFEFQRQVEKHLKEHTEQRPHKCAQCGRSFKQKHNLTAHIRLHSGHRPFTCHGCKKTFSRKGQVILHLKQHPELGPNAFSKTDSPQ